MSLHYKTDKTKKNLYFGKHILGNSLPMSIDIQPYTIAMMILEIVKKLSVDTLSINYHTNQSNQYAFLLHFEQLDYDHLILSYPIVHIQLF